MMQTLKMPQLFYSKFKEWRVKFRFLNHIEILHNVCLRLLQHNFVFLWDRKYHLQDICQDFWAFSSPPHPTIWRMLEAQMCLAKPWDLHESTPSFWDAEEPLLPVHHIWKPGSFHPMPLWTSNPNLWALTILGCWCFTVNTSNPHLNENEWELSHLFNLRE